ncbi:MAG: acyltransferase family protein [Mobilitalea sp.]
MDFVNYSNYKIELANLNVTFAIIILLVIFITLVTAKKQDNHFFDIQATQSLRGAAILCLLIGHLSIKCLNDKNIFNLGGYLAVIIFLFISGYATYQKNGLTNKCNYFLIRRILKLYPALWITLILFIFLDDILINLKHSFAEIMLNLIGVHFNDMLLRVNAAAWFIEYIMVLYIVYWLVSKLSFSENIKIITITLICMIISIIIRITPINHYHAIWIHYTIVFPMGIAFGKYVHVFSGYELNTRWRYINIISLFFISLAFFYAWNDIVPVSFLGILRPFPFITAMISFLLLFEKLNIQSSFLLLLGNYSYEIYLLHGPFMVKYDFILFRKPIYLSFLVYLFFLVVLSFILSRLSSGVSISIHHFSTMLKNTDDRKQT